MIKEMRKTVLERLNKGLDYNDTGIFVALSNNYRKVQKMSFFSLFINYIQIKRA